MGDDALVAATGRNWDQWFAILDDAGAVGWRHPVIARWLQEEHGVPPWWCQGITVGFEQARGIRLPGQRQDGLFEVSASATFPLGQDQALDAVVEAVTAGIGAPPASESRQAKYITARWKLDAREFILATANPSRSGKTSVSLTRQRMTHAEQVGAAKAAMQEWLAAAAANAPGGLG
jgi:hypothetical protein